MQLIITIIFMAILVESTPTFAFDANGILGQRAGLPFEAPRSMKNEALIACLKAGGCLVHAPPWGVVEVRSKENNIETVREWVDSKFTNTNNLSHPSRGCYLTSKGKMKSGAVIDARDDGSFILLLENIAVVDELVSEVFPMDGVSVKKCESSLVLRMFALEAKSLEDVVRDRLGAAAKRIVSPKIAFGFLPSFVTQTTESKKVARVGISEMFLVLDGSEDEKTNALVDLTADIETEHIPLALHAEDMDGFRALCGLAALNFEYGCDGSFDLSPLELNLLANIDLDKGCYLGQEGVSALRKNKRGYPRFLYRAVLEDDEGCELKIKIGDDITRKDDGAVIGKISSLVRYPGGKPIILALVVIKRGNGIVGNFDSVKDDFDHYNLDKLEIKGGMLHAIGIGVDNVDNVDNIDEGKRSSEEIKLQDRIIAVENDELEREKERKREKMGILKARAEAALAARKSRNT